MGKNKQVTYTNWAFGEPINSLNVERCISVYGTLHPSIDHFKWNDIFCSIELNFICEQDEVKGK